MKHEICSVSEIPEAGSKLFPFFDRHVHVYRRHGRPVAVANACLHFGGPLASRDGKLVCEWHGAEFDMTTGMRLMGPAPKQSKLMFLSTLEEDGKLFYVWGGDNE